MLGESKKIKKYCYNCWAAKQAENSNIFGQENDKGEPLTTCHGYWTIDYNLKKWFILDEVLENEEDLVTISIESELKITDVEWSDNLTDPDSEMYLDMQNELEGDMTDVFCDDENSTFAMVDNDTCSIEVTNFTEGSVIIQFFLTKMELNSTLQKKADSDFLAEMGEKMNKKGLKKFKVDKKSLKISKYLAISWWNCIVGSL